MATKIVLDSLARSGTTLASAILHSQPNIACYRGVFHELKSALPPRFWPYGLLKYGRKIRGADVNVRHRTSNIHQLYGLLNRRLVIDEQRLRHDTLSVLHRENQYGNLSEQEWRSLVNVELLNLGKIDALYDKIAKTLDVTSLCFRWNQGVAYIDNWINRPNHRWVSIIRNPWDRACSSFKTHKWRWDKSLESTLIYLELLNSYKGNANVKIVYYEDIVENTEQTVKELVSFVGGEPEPPVIVDDIYGQDGRPYRVETADLVDKHGTHKCGKTFTGYATSSMGRYRNEMPDRVRKKFNRCLRDYTLVARYY